MPETIVIFGYEHLAATSNTCYNTEGKSKHKGHEYAEVTEKEQSDTDAAAARKAYREL